MAKKTGNIIRLGVFVLAGLFVLVLVLYIIGKNQNLFGRTFLLKARFENVQGLVAGNNVRFSGITVGTVKQVVFVNDTCIEVVMTLREQMKQFVRKSAVVSIGTEGLMGNKVVNIVSSRVPASLVHEDDVLSTRKAPDTDEMLRTLQKTNEDVAGIAANLKMTIERINTSTALWKLMNDETLPQNLRTAGYNIQRATGLAAVAASDLQHVIQQVRDGKGSIGALIADTLFTTNLNAAVLNIQGVGDRANELALTLDSIARAVKADVTTGKGTVNALLKDSSMVVKLNNSLENIQKGTGAFSENMEALKHNFLFRGYFRKQERKKQREAAGTVAVQSIK